MLCFYLFVWIVYFAFDNFLIKEIYYYYYYYHYHYHYHYHYYYYNEWS